MLCEKCQERNATVHFTALEAAKGMLRHDFCEQCYADFEEGRIAQPVPEPAVEKPLPSDVKHITALEFLFAGNKASSSSADRTIYRHIKSELKRFPITQQRLAFEFFELAWKCLERGEDPGLLAALAVFRRGAIEPARLPEFVEWLEKIIMRCSELKTQFSVSPDKSKALELTLSFLVLNLGNVDRQKFASVLQKLPQSGDDPTLDILLRSPETLASRQNRLMKSAELFS